MYADHLYVFYFSDSGQKVADQGRALQGCATLTAVPRCQEGQVDIDWTHEIDGFKHELFCCCVGSKCPMVSVPVSFFDEVAGLMPSSDVIGVALALILSVILIMVIGKGIIYLSPLTRPRE